MTVEYIPLRPALDGPFAKRFYSRIERLAKAHVTYPEIESAVEEEISWAYEAKANPKQRRIYRAIWLLFRDLLRVGWSYRWVGGTLEITPPSLQELARTPQDINRAKEQIREAMKVPRLERIAEAKDFIERMENPAAKAAASVSIKALIANGQELATELANIAALSDRQAQLRALKEAVQPYLQLVEENVRCEYTGHKLSDIWRYFRLTWATPADNTPGRTMLYLIRDAARTNHPVIGIASLENTPLRIACRDNELGWSLEAFQAKIEAATDQELIRAEFGKLLKYAQTAIEEISLEKLCSPDELQNPDEILFQKLNRIAARSTKERDAALDKWRQRLQDNDEDDDLAVDRSELGNISRAAEEALYRRKRAGRLVELLVAKKDLDFLLKQDDANFKIYYPKFFSKERGQSVIRTTLRALKNRHVGTSILELNVCGAIPPYNEIWGGKLVALLNGWRRSMSKWRWMMRFWRRLKPVNQWF